MTRSAEEFAAFVEESQHALLSYIFAFVHNMHDAEDLYQQTLAVLWKKFESFDRTADFSKWARGVARFEVSNFLRKKRTNRVYFSEALVAEVDQAISDRESPQHMGVMAALRRCVKKLSDVDGRLIQAFYGGVPAKVLAEQGKRSVEGVYNALGRIRRALSDCVRRAMAEEDRP